ncbi:MAG: thiolase family protein [Bacteroidota bacterium]
MSKVFVLSAVRTPIGRFGGALKDHSPVDLAAPVMSVALDQAGISGSDLDLYVFGNVLRAGQGQLVPRQAAFKAGIPDSVDGVAVDMVCSSGMMSLMQASAFIRAGDADLVLAGGTESMSGAGFYLSSRARWGYKYLAGRPEPVVDILERDGLSDPFSNDAMGELTEQLAAERGATRAELDDIAAASNVRAAQAHESGAFEAELVPIEYCERRTTQTLARDEGVRPETTVESLGKLRPAFRPDGVLTAGNSSQISDGSAALMLASEKAVEAHGLTPIAELTGSSWAAGQPYRFPEAPIPAIARLCEKLGREPQSFGLYENNEAFALNSLLIHRQLGVPYEKLNVNGGAIALGHPIGCSGARIVVTLIHALRNRSLEDGLASICHGTGGGTALSVKAL